MTITASTFTRIFQDQSSIHGDDKSIATSITSYDRNRSTAILQFIIGGLTLGIAYLAIEAYRNSVKSSKVEEFKNCASELLDQLTKGKTDLTADINIDGQETEMNFSQGALNFSTGGVSKSITGMTFEKAQKKLILDILLNKDLYFSDTVDKAAQLFAEATQHQNATMSKREIIDSYFGTTANLKASDIALIYGHDSTSAASQHFTETTSVAYDQLAHNLPPEENSRF